VVAGGEGGLLVRGVLVGLALVELDPVVDQVRVEVLDLILRELDLLESGDDLVVREKALFDALLNQLVELFDVGKGDVDSEQLDLRLPRANGRG